MTKFINASQGFSLKDLTQKDGFAFEIGDDFENLDEEEFCYSSDLPLSNEEALNLLNMDDFQDEEDYDNNRTTENSISICGLSFEKLKAKMTNVTKDGKVMKLIKQKGVGGIIPYDAQVTIKYIAHFEYSDEPFDSSFARGGAETFCLNQGALIPGLEIGLLSMQKHEIAIFIVHPDLAYGKCGCAPRIPPNEHILYVVHVIDYLDSGCIESYKSLSIEEQKLFANIVKRVQAKFNTAKDCFKKNKIKQAIREYSRGVQWLEQAALKDQEEEDVANKLLSRGYNNLAVCYNLVNMPRRVCNSCNRIPIPTSKTHFNYGRALLKMGEYDRAMEKLQIALQMEPKNEEIIKEIRLANEKQRKYLEMEKQLWSKCLKNEDKPKKESAFEKAAHDICEAFVQDSELLRQPLPESLTPDEDKCIRQQAAAFGLVVTTHQRYGREVTYLNKFNY
ncbi:inactive peptidyl-prolyl cis-trans isomerase FKBP6 [Osmia bicornis bicornis]|uniref:inactive peptidyl-prolyl cis-trans isomerase FKBP6 n=1 Tax=Osmia bicornis bicornis TaxID=1437191 RepID=UPI001EAEA8CC|nr:inactive peptidyl-prolyl cis-trans isomerase FKBP6 [Osmia bicornis bicornis]